MTKEDTTYTPLGDVVIIKVDQPKTQTDSGILVKEDWKTLPPTGIVVGVGSGVQTNDFGIGDRVVFERYSAITLEDDLRLCRVKHVLAVKNGS